MDRGDEMRKDAGPSQVRILPAVGDAPEAPLHQPTATSRRWFTPALLAVGLLAVFVFATRPADSTDVVTPTTRPPSIAAIEALPIDLATPLTLRNTSETWTSSPFGWDAEIGDVFRMSSSFVAVGSTADGAKVWLSGNGSSWKETTTLELPASAKTSIDHVVPWDGGVIALGPVDEGVGVWTADTPSEWLYQGRVDSIDRPTISGLAAGKELIAISTAVRSTRGWMSSDGIEWRSLGALDDLIDAEVFVLAATEDWYFAGGRVCDDVSCRPVIYQSADGLRWETTDGVTTGTLAGDDGAVMDITTRPSGLVAVGTVGRFPEGRVVVWSSEDGSSWQQTSPVAPAFAPQTITLEVVATRTDANPSATIILDGSEYEVTAGSEIVTDGGPIPIAGITDSYILLGEERSRRRIELETPTQITTVAGPRHIVAEGPRLAIGGSLFNEYSSTPVVWTSADRGATWDRMNQLAASGSANDVVLAGRNIVATGRTTDGLFVWRTTWDTEAAGDAAIALLAGFTDALNRHHSADVIGQLPQSDENPTAHSFELPSLGGIVQQWWDPGNGRLQADEVAATIAYLAATETSVELSECTASVSLGTSDRTNVVCDFTVDSTLMSVFGLAGDDGRIRALVRNGQLDTVDLEVAPSEPMWVTLRSRIGPSDTRLVLNRSTAQTHITAAKEFIAALLVPGESKVVTTALGTMEWTWTSPDDLGIDVLSNISWSRFGFIAIGYSEVGPRAEPEVSLWVSQDGLNWSALATPEHAEGLWGLKPFLDGVIGQTWVDEKVGLVYYDGVEWTEILLPQPTRTQYFDLVQTAIAGDQLMVITGWSTSVGEQTREAHVIGPDLVPHVVQLPPQEEFGDVNIELAGSEEGFILATSGYGTQVSMSVWHTRNGLGWTLLTEAAPLEDAQYVWNLQQHRSQYFVVGDAAELRCSTSSQGEVCVSLSGLWRSPDGAAWSQVLTSSGQQVSTYDIGSGPLGLVAIGQQYADNNYPRAVYTSVDGLDWDQASDLALLDPGSQWWWSTTPAVGKDTVILAGSGFSEGAESSNDRPFIIVGHLIDP